ncbi:MAG: FecR family protein [Limnothrix sp.]
MKSQTQQYLSSFFLGLTLSLGMPTVFVPQPIAAQSVSSSRTLEVKRVRGRVTLRNSFTRVNTGDRLTSTGQGVTTGARSSAVLAVDTGIGTINVAENTSFFLREFRTTANGGKATVLEVTKGQVRINVRSFTNPQSKLEVRTPAGIAGVRGTDFGVAVADDGQMNVMTNEGAVEVMGVEESVTVNAGYASILVEGEAPTEPKLFIENLDLGVQPAQLMESGRWEVSGQVDPFNFVWVDDEQVQIEQDGTFSLDYDRIPETFIKIRVLTPLGSTKTTYAFVRRAEIPFILINGDRDESEF